MDPLGVILVGCGKILRKHRAALERLPAARVAGVVDLDAGRAAAVGEELGVPHGTSLADVKGRTDASVAVVLTPSGNHHAVAREALELGLHAVVEKPLALRVEHVEDLLALAADNELGLYVVNQNRCNRPVAAVRRALDEGRFGRLVLGSVRVRWRRTQEYYDQAAWRGTWALDGGVLANQALHHLDMLLWMMGEVESVGAAVSTRLVDIEAEDTAIATIRFRNGALGVIEATTATRPDDLEGSLSILGERGAVELGGFAMNELATWRFADDGPEPSDEDRVNPTEFAWNHEQYLGRTLAELAAGRVDRSQGEEALGVVRILEAIYDSAAEDRFVAPGERLGHSLLGGSADA